MLFRSIQGTSYSGTDSKSASAQFTCFVKASVGKFVIPAFVLEALPAGSGSITLYQFSTSTFTAPGLDSGFAITILGNQANVTFQ